MMNSHRSDTEKVSLIGEGKKEIGINEVIKIINTCKHKNEIILLKVQKKKY